MSSSVRSVLFLFAALAFIVACLPATRPRSDVNPSSPVSAATGPVPHRIDITPATIDRGATEPSVDSDNVADEGEYLDPTAEIPETTSRPTFLLSRTCVRLSSYTRRPLNPASPDECVYDASADLLFERKGDSIFRSGEYSGKLFRFVDEQVYAIADRDPHADEYPDLLDYNFDGCPLSHIVRPHFIAHAADIERHVYVDLLRHNAPGGEIMCRTTWRNARGGCLQDPPCPPWFSAKATMVGRATPSGLVLIVPPPGFR